MRNKIKYENILPESIKYLFDALDDFLSNPFKYKDRSSKISPEQACNFLKAVHLLYPEITLGEVFLVFSNLSLEGLCSDKISDQLSFPIRGIYVNKASFKKACLFVFGHQYLRPIAQVFAEEICTYALMNHISGDLAFLINKRIDRKNNFLLASNPNAELEPTLTFIEMAWACSFSSQIPGLSGKATPRLAAYLKQLNNEYYLAFAKEKLR